MHHANIGYLLAGLGSNANTFISCRANYCDYGARVLSSNQNHFIACNFEGGGYGVDLNVGDMGGFCARNYITDCRFEQNSRVNLRALHGDVQDAIWRGNYHVDGDQYFDAGTRTHIEDYFPNSDTSEAFSATTARMSADGCYKWERTAAVMNPHVPMAVFNDSNPGVGTPTTIKAITERSSGNFFEGERGGTTYIALRADGTIVLGGGAQIRHGTGDPNTQVSAPAGSTYHRTDAGPGPKFWVKEFGVGDTGWVAK